MIKPKFIGIAGGTGAGKSTVCTALMDKYPDKIGLIQLDDYFKPANEVPKLSGHENWDHPSAIYLKKLARDLANLAKGKRIIANTKNLRLNPDYVKTGKRIPVEFKPRPIMLVEGYLVLYEQGVRKLLSTSIWLDAGHKTRWSRRVHFKYPEYEQKVLLPMYKKYAEPTKHFAHHVIDVTNKSLRQIISEMEELVIK
jgi:uridine kinase